jgi:hypothetical protein
VRKQLLLRHEDESINAPGQKADDEEAEVDVLAGTLALAHDDEAADYDYGDGDSDYYDYYCGYGNNSH